MYRTLYERLNRMTMQILNQKLEDFPEIRTFLRLPISELPKQYINLLPPGTPSYLARGMSLMDVLNLYSAEEELGTRNYLSCAGDKPVGWICYRIEDRKVAEIDIISFEPDQSNIVLMRDLREVLEDLLDLYGEITFQSTYNNPFNKSYDRYIQLMHGTREDRDGMYWYNVKAKDAFQEEGEGVMCASALNGQVPEHCNRMISLIDGGAVDELENQKGEEL